MGRVTNYHCGEGDLFPLWGGWPIPIGGGWPIAIADPPKSSKILPMWGPCTESLCGGPMWRFCMWDHRGDSLCGADVENLYVVGLCRDSLCGANVEIIM